MGNKNFGPIKSMELENSMDNPGTVEKRLIRVSEDGFSKVTKINNLGSSIRDSKGLVSGF